MDLWKTVVWRQFGAAIDMLDNAIAACPERVWADPADPAGSQFWYRAYHVLFFLDCYLSGSDPSWAPPAPFTMSEADPSGRLPDRTYTKDELRTYLAHGRKKCRATIEVLTDARARERCEFPWGAMPFAELLLHNVRHVQHHTAQLNSLLRQKTDSAPGWVFRAKDEESVRASR